jgi:hypothetical protein
VKLKSDPYPIFMHSKTPAALYARKKFLQQGHSSGFRHDFDETVELLLSGQSADGSWDQSFLKTIRRLFGLHLTIRDEIEPVRKGLQWLTDRTLSVPQQQSIRAAEEATKDGLAGLPFTEGSSALLFAAATLFLASVFDHREDPGILYMYDWFLSKGSKGSGRWCGWSSYSNILRAFVVHPRYAGSKAVALAVRNLGQVQKETGIWIRSIPFCLTVNALAHLDSTEGDAQLAVAFERLYKTQRHDGTWSRSQPEWNTFLVIHALKNKGEL